MTGCPDRLTITADASTDTHEDLLRVHVEILKICLTGLLLAQLGCAGVGPTRSGMASLRADMQDILEGQKRWRSVLMRLNRELNCWKTGLRALPCRVV